MTQLNAIDCFDSTAAGVADRDGPIMCGALPPVIQTALLRATPGPAIKGLDTNEYWIRRMPSHLMEAVAAADLVMFNQREVCELTGMNADSGARALLALGPQAVIVKCGREGVVLVDHQGEFHMPACQATRTLDPTGAGDSYDGAVFGFLVRSGAERLSRALLLEAMTYGAVVSSFTVEGLGADALAKLSPEHVEKRREHYRSRNR